VVALGESLWSVSARWLGPWGPTHQIADGVTRIYALNLERIGDDPDLIFAGRRLLLPSKLVRQSPEPGRAAPMGRAVGEADHEEGQARNDAQSELTLLPEPPRSVPVVAVRMLAPHNSPLSGARSAFSAFVATAVEAYLPKAYSGPKSFGGALIVMSSVLALILALQVAREGWVPSSARRRATRERWVREALRGTQASLGPFVAGFAYPAASGFEVRPPADSPSEEATPAAPAESAQAGGAGGRLANRKTSLGNIRKVERSRLARIHKARALEANRPARGHRASAAGVLPLSRAGQRPPKSLAPAPRTRALRRKGARIVGTEPREPRPMQEWKIGEPLRRAMRGIPVQPGAPLRDALLEVKPLVADELTTVASLEQRRRLSNREQRQARALRDFWTMIDDVSNEAGIG
jgi:hypothetical protein